MKDPSEKVIQPGDKYLGHADHIWKLEQRPEVEIVRSNHNSVTYRYIDIGVPNERCVRGIPR